RLARASRLRALELGHPQLEDPRRVFLRMIGAEENAALAAPVETREIRLWIEARARARAMPANVDETVHDEIHRAKTDERCDEPAEHLPRDNDGVSGCDEVDRCSEHGREKYTEPERHERGPAE